jgi:hypothetical protein
MVSFAVANKCSDPFLTHQVGEGIAGCLEIQLNRDFSAHYGGNYRVRWCTPDNPPAAGEVVALITDTLPDAPGAVGYHDWQGAAAIYVARSMCSTLTQGALSVSQCLSHECLEEAGDRACNLWADDYAGTEWAMEMCDAVEAGYYTIGASGPGMACDASDFVLPAFFAPGDVQGPYSLLGAAPGPFTTAPGGYQIRRSSGTGEASVTGEIHPQRRLHKAHFSSRTRRRGVKL